MEQLRQQHHSHLAAINQLPIAPVMWTAIHVPTLPVVQTIVITIVLDWKGSVLRVMQAQMGNKYRIAVSWTVTHCLSVGNAHRLATDLSRIHTALPTGFSFLSFGQLDCKKMCDHAGSDCNFYYLWHSISYDPVREPTRTLTEY